MKCVRCKINKVIEFEKICQNCAKELRKKFRISKDKDIMENSDIRRLIRDYEKYY